MYVSTNPQVLEITSNTCLTPFILTYSYNFLFHNSLYDPGTTGSMYSLERRVSTSNTLHTGIGIIYGS